jgi:hypothetical protein
MRRNENVLTAGTESRYPSSFRGVVREQIAFVSPLLRRLSRSMMPSLERETNYQLPYVGGE